LAHCPDCQTHSSADTKIKDMQYIDKDLEKETKKKEKRQGVGWTTVTQ